MALFSDLLNYWQTQPLFWLSITCFAFYIGQLVYQASGRNAFLPPILTAVALIISTLYLTNTSYETYMTGGQYLYLMLGPVVVVLAVPLAQHIHTMRKQLFRIILALAAGSGTTVLVAAWLTDVWLGEEIIRLSILTKSVTTPIAISVSEEIGGSASLAAGFVIVTGILAALMTPILLRAIRQDDPATLGLTLGTCGHAIGTSRALELSNQHAAYAATAMTLTGSLHAIALPLLFT